MRVLVLGIAAHGGTLKFSLTCDDLNQRGMEAPMKPLSLTVLILFCLPLVGSAGCASLSKYMPWGEKSDQDSQYEDDPVAAAAMRLRRPASSASAADASDDRGWSRRYAAPAETISYGMAMEEVQAVWGEPSAVDSAGDSRDGNQRWTYYSGLSSRYGLGSKRIVYFENGHVAGWKN